MTIKQIKSILPKPVLINLSEIKASRLAIDTSIFLYKYKYFKPIEQEFVECFDSLINQFKKNDIRPIFIFDGKPPPLKQAIISGRQKAKENKEDAIKITFKDIEALKTFFDNNEIDYYTANGEAEKECCKLEATGQADYILSNDFDVFLFGGQKLIRSNKGIYELYDWDTIQDYLNLSRKEFQMLAISIGCDYLPSGIKGYGPIKSLDYIKKHKCLPDHSIDSDLLNAIYKEFETEIESECQIKQSAIFCENCELEQHDCTCYS